MVTMSLGELAEALSLSKQAVGLLVRSKVVVKVGKDSYDAVASVRNYIEGQRSRSESPRLTEARARVFEERAKLATLERLEREGAVAPIAHFPEALNFLNAVLRLNLTSLPTRIAAKCGMARSATDMQKIAEAEVAAMLEAISQTDAGPGIPAAQVFAPYYGNEDTRDEDPTASFEAGSIAAEDASGAGAVRNGHARRDATTRRS